MGSFMKDFSVIWKNRIMCDRKKIKMHFTAPTDKKCVHTFSSWYSHPHSHIDIHIQNYKIIFSTGYCDFLVLADTYNNYRYLLKKIDITITKPRHGGGRDIFSRTLSFSPTLPSRSCSHLSLSAARPRQCGGAPRQHRIQRRAAVFSPWQRGSGSGATNWRWNSVGC